MSPILFTVFLTSVIMSVARNILSKSISVYKFGTKSFFKTQCLIFFTGFIILTIPAFKTFSALSWQTVISALIYALLLITAQWNYTAAMGKIPASVCVTVYSCGFVFPALSGALFWGEKFTVPKFFSIILTILVILTANYEKKSSALPKKDFFRLIFAMAASGGLGIMQKSSFDDERAMFIMLSFLFAGIFSLISEKLSTAEKTITPKNTVYSCIAGICFACCNLLNTYLAGKLDSAFFFPVQNMAVIMTSIVICVCIFRERLRKKEIVALILGIGAILLNR